MSPTVKNGGFESGTSSNFHSVEVWFNANTVAPGSNAIARLSTAQNVNAVRSGSYGGWLRKSENPYFAADLDCVVQSNDVFTYTFEMSPGYLWATNTDKIQVLLYVGNVAAPTWVSGVEFAINKSGWNTYTWTTPAITNSAVIGGRLGVRIYGKTQTAGSSGFIDNINISVIRTAVPVKSKLVVVVGLAGLLAVRCRRYSGSSDH